MPSSRNLGLVGRSVRTAFRYMFQRLAPEQGFVQVDQHAAPAFGDGVNQVLRLGLAGGGPVGDTHGGVELDGIPFDAEGLTPQIQGAWQKLALAPVLRAQAAPVLIAALSMDKPHAVRLVDDVDDVDTAPVEVLGPLIECHPRRSGVQNKITFSHQCARGDKLVQHRLNPVCYSLGLKKFIANLHQIIRSSRPLNQFLNRLLLYLQQLEFDQYFCGMARMLVWPARKVIQARACAHKYIRRE